MTIQLRTKKELPEYHKHHMHVSLHLGVAFLVKVNIVVEQFDKELYLS